MSLSSIVLSELFQVNVYVHFESPASARSPAMECTLQRARRGVLDLELVGVAHELLHVSAALAVLRDVV